MRGLTLAVALVLTASAGACAPKPIIARDPVPAPAPGVGYACDSRPTVLNGFYTDCVPVAPAPTVVLHSKG